MKRFHLNLKVSDLKRSTEFYSHLLGAEPTLVKEDYVKWMLDDPYINLSIEPVKNGLKGIAHVGIQAETQEDLQTAYQHAKDAAGPRFEEGATTCCYAASEKNWTKDPDGVIWEIFYTQGQIDHYGSQPQLNASEASQSVCCAS